MTLSVALTHAREGFALDIDFEVPRGATALFGRSGAGKTSIVNTVAGLLKPDSGRITLEDTVLCDTEQGIWLPPHKRRLGYVFQDGRLFPHMTVRRNLLYGQPVSRRRSGADVNIIVDLLGIGDLLGRYPNALSGGEKQRVAIGRALLSEPRLLLLDEPLAALDEARKAEILPYLERIRDVSDVPMLYVSHSVAEVARLATSVVALHQGRVLKCGPAEDILSDPQIVPAIGVRQLGAVLGGTVVRHHADGLTEIALSQGVLFLPRVEAEIGSRLRVRVGAQDVLVSLAAPKGMSALNTLACKIVALRKGDGPGVVVQLSCGNERLLARITRRSAKALALRPGLTVYAIIKSLSIAHADVGQGGAL